MTVTFSIDDLLVSGTLGPIAPGATRDAVLAVLGPPSTHSYGTSIASALIWVYGETCHGHLELHFDDSNALRAIFSDYLPLRRHRGTSKTQGAWRLDPGCLGGLVAPSVVHVRAVLARRGIDAVPQRRDVRWSSPPPSTSFGRVPIASWKKVKERAECVERLDHPR